MRPKLTSTLENYKWKVKILKDLCAKLHPASSYASTPVSGTLPYLECGQVLLQSSPLLNSVSCRAPQWKSLCKSFQNSESRQQLKADGGGEAFLALQADREGCFTGCNAALWLAHRGSLMSSFKFKMTFGEVGVVFLLSRAPAITPLSFPLKLKCLSDVFHLPDLLYIIFFSLSMRI